jgi:enoyl-CoA hydratase/carnithine racemase
VAGAGGLVRLPRTIPGKLAHELILTGRAITAREAGELHLVNRVVPKGTAVSAARTLAEEIIAAWTAAWADPHSPEALPMPLQSIISEPALRHIDVLAAAGDPGAQALATYWVGQGVGLLNSVRPVHEVVYKMAQDLLAAADRLADSLR